MRKSEKQGKRKNEGARWRERKEREKREIKEGRLHQTQAVNYRPGNKPVSIN